MNLKKLSFSLLATALSLLIIFSAAYLSLHHTKKVEAQTTPIPGIFTMSGYAWSSNIGWISMSGTAADNTQYGVSFDSTGQPTSNSYAWSPNVGWLNFGPNGCAADGGDRVVYNPTTQKFTGFAQFLSAGGANTGWDGCVSMSGTAQDGNTYPGMQAGSGVSITTGATSTPISGYIWGSYVVGWINMSGVTMTVGGPICTKNSDCSGGETCDTTTGTCTCPAGDPQCPGPVYCPDGISSPPCPVTSSNTLVSAAPTACTSSIYVSWKSDATNFILSRGSTQVYNGTGNGNGGGGYTDPGLNPNTQYTYTLIASNSGSNQSATVSTSATTADPNSQSCQNTNGTFTITPPVIQSGGYCTLKWTGVTAPGSTCVVSGGSGTSAVNITLTPGSNPGSFTDGTYNTPTLTQTVPYTLSCTNSTTQSQTLSITKSCKVEDIHEF